MQHLGHIQQGGGRPQLLGSQDDQLGSRCRQGRVELSLGHSGSQKNHVPPPPPEQRVEYYVIQKGDTLSKIAKQYLGNAMDYPKIFEANREVIKDPDLIYPGQKIRIPLE